MPSRSVRVFVEKLRLARCEPHHPLDEIHAAHLFGHAVLNLQSSVHFEEIELSAVRIENKLDRASRTIVHKSAELHRCIEERRALHVIETGCGSFLDDFLISPLRRAIAFAQREDAPFAIAENLHLDVPRVGDEFFEKDAGLLEIAATQPLDRRIRFRQFRLAPADFHTDAAAARRALQHHGVADARSLSCCIIYSGQQSGARQQRHTGALREFARCVLESEDAHLFRRRSDECETCAFARLREVCIFAQKSVARMHRLRTRLAGGGENFLHAQIAFSDWRGAEQHGFICIAHVQ